MARQPRIEYPSALYHVMARIDLDVDGFWR
jgi:hypothetical protein